MQASMQSGQYQCKTKEIGDLSEKVAEKTRVGQSEQVKGWGRR